MLDAQCRLHGGQNIRHHGLVEIGYGIDRSVVYDGVAACFRYLLHGILRLDDDRFEQLALLFLHVLLRNLHEFVITGFQVVQLLLFELTDRIRHGRILVADLLGVFVELIVEFHADGFELVLQLFLVGFEVFLHFGGLRHCENQLLHVDPAEFLRKDRGRTRNEGDRQNDFKNFFHESLDVIDF